MQKDLQGERTTESDYKKTSTNYSCQRDTHVKLLHTNRDKAQKNKHIIDYYKAQKTTNIL